MQTKIVFLLIAPCIGFLNFPGLRLVISLDTGNVSVYATCGWVMPKLQRLQVILLSQLPWRIGDMDYIRNHIYTTILEI